jgi:hypothetical protein
MKSDESKYQNLIEHVLKTSEHPDWQLKHLVGNGEGQVALLRRVESFLIASTTKVKDIGKTLRTARTNVLSAESPTERSQALLSFLCTAERIPCPKLIVLVPQCKAEFDT